MGRKAGSKEGKILGINREAIERELLVKQRVWFLYIVSGLFQTEKSGNIYPIVTSNHDRKSERDKVENQSNVFKSKSHTLDQMMQGADC